jgi:ABC-type lipoprotein release transport system permease subunit
VGGDDVEQGELVQRRLEVSGFVRTGNPEVDDRLAYVRTDVLTGMLGTAGPNEVVVILDDIEQLAPARDAAISALSGTEGANVYIWSERNPALASLIEVDSESGNMMYIILFLLVALGVVNATFMSVLERTKEFGVMLALGTRRVKLFYLVMSEVGLLGLVSVAAGTALGLGLEMFGRVHGWPMEWFGYEEMESTSMAGVVYDDIYYSALSVENGAVIAVGVYVMFLLAGLLPAIRASRLAPVEAMRVK